MPDPHDRWRPAPGDPSMLRIGDKERHAVAEVLREAAGEGRIDLDELEERLEATYAARTFADLVPITADLPTPHRPGGVPGMDVVHARPAPPPVLGPQRTGSFALMSETRRTGPWQVAETHWALAVMGSVVLDLRQAHFAARELVVTANAVMGAVEIVVDPHTYVIVSGQGVMGEYGEGRSEVALQPRPDSRVVRVRGVALMGSVEVRRRI